MDEKNPSNTYNFVSSFDKRGKGIWRKRNQTPTCSYKQEKEKNDLKRFMDYFLQAEKG